MAGENDVSLTIQLIDEITGPLGKIREQLGGVKEELAGLAVAFISLDTGFKVFDAAASSADKLQDLSRALNTFTGSVAAGTQALQFFNQAADHTRSTGIELAEAFNRILPMGQAQGWSTEALQQMTVMLDQLAALSGRGASELESGFARLLAVGAGSGGGSSSRNALLQVLGITREQLQQAGDDAGQLISDAIKAKIDAAGGTIPDSLHSAWAKAKDDLSTAIGTGFAQSFGQESEGMRGLRDMFKDPQLLDNVRSVGRILGQSLVFAVDLFNNAMALAKAAAQPPSSGNALLNSNIFTLGLASAGAIDPLSGDPQFLGGLLRPGDYESDMAGLAGIYSMSGAMVAGPQAGKFGGRPAKPADDISQLNDQYKKLIDNMNVVAGLGGDIVGFATQHADEIVKITDGYTNLLGYLPSLIGMLRATAAEAGKITLPQGQSFGGAVSAATQAGAFSATITNADGFFLDSTGNWVLDPKIVAADAAKIDAFINLQQEGDVKLYQWELQQQTAQAKLVAEAWKQEFSNAFSDLFADLGTTGGQNFGKILTQTLSNQMKQVGQQIAGAIGDALGPLLQPSVEGVSGQGPYGIPLSSDAANARAAQGDINAGQLSSSAFMAAGLVYSASSGALTPLQGALQGGSLGFQAGGALDSVLGTSIGAVGYGLIGAFVGALVGALTEQLPTIQSYFQPVIKNGVAQLTGMVGEILSNPAEQKQDLAKVQASFDEFRNGYVSIFLNLPTDLRDTILPSLAQTVKKLMTGGFASGTYGLGGGPYNNGGDPYAPPDPNAPYATQTQVQGWFQAWVDQTMPHSVMEVFRNNFQTAFEDMGGTVDKFNQIWTNAEQMDPKAALQYLTDYFNVVSTMNQLLAQIGGAVGVGTTGGLYGKLLAAGHESLAGQLSDADKNIVDLGQNLQYLTGQSQIDAAKQLNTLIQNRYTLETQMVQNIVNMIQSAEASLASNLLTIQLRGKTPQQQYGVYQQQISAEEAQLTSATNPADATAIYNQLVQNIMTASGLFPNDKGIQSWAATTLTSLEKQYEQILKGFGSAIDAANAQFEQQMKPIVAEMTSITNQFGVDLTAAGTSVAAMDQAASSAATSITNMADAANYFVSVMADNGYVAATRRARAPR